ncbi:MAG: deaminase [Paludibacteraceae bacterium]|nr:deaminase [Paludibacteraceae bacterium]
MKNKHKLFMDIAKCFATQSTCCRKQVGAVLVKNGRIISTGYNGTAAGHKHCNEIERFSLADWNHVNLDSSLSAEHHKFSVENEVHAEQNVIAFAAKNGVSTDGCALYITLAPCSDCSKLIVAAGISEVYFLEEYDRCSSGVNFLEASGLTVKQLSDCE